MTNTTAAKAEQAKANTTAAEQTKAEQATAKAKAKTAAAAKTAAKAKAKAAAAAKTAAAAKAKAEQAAKAAEQATLFEQAAAKAAAQAAAIEKYAAAVTAEKAARKKAAADGAKAADKKALEKAEKATAKAKAAAEKLIDRPLIVEKKSIANDLDIAPRKEQKAVAKAAAQGANYATMAELYADMIKSFAFTFSKKLYTDGSGDFLPDGESRYYHAKVTIEFLQQTAINYKIAALNFAEDKRNGAKAAEFKARRTAFYNALKAFKIECGIDTHCTAADCESISTYAARYIYSSADIKKGMCNTTSTTAQFCLNVFKYLSTGAKGAEQTKTAAANKVMRSYKAAAKAEQAAK